jgi:hypothetical protein
VLTDCRQTSPDIVMWAADLADTSTVDVLALQAWDVLCPT